jgi:hypothetical protein
MKTVLNTYKNILLRLSENFGRTSLSDFVLSFPTSCYSIKGVIIVVTLSGDTAGDGYCFFNGEK